MSGGVQK